MKISIYGVGYVGLVTGVCLAKLGHDVCCYDIDTKKISDLQKGIVPIYEENLENFLSDTIENHRIHFTTDFNHVADYGFIHLIAVGTPPCPDGSADLSHVRDVITRLSKTLTEYRVIVNKSTVPVGTADEVQKIMGEHFDVVSNPEFLKEGKAIHDFMHPDRIIIGSTSERAVKYLRELYAPLVDTGIPFVIMKPRSAELCKYASNTFLATKISFMNEMSRLAEALGADIQEIQVGMGYDRRIGDQFLNAGCGYGGSCFPKDVSALEALVKHLKIELPILKSIEKTNEQQKNILFEKIFHYFNGNLSDRRIALWGLAFKPGTDDIRCAPSLILMEKLWKAGAMIQAYDPMAMKNIRERYENHSQLYLCDSPESALINADILVIVTEWPLFLNPDFEKIKKLLRCPIIFDGRNIYDPKIVKSYGLEYCGIGRGNYNLFITSRDRQGA